MDGVEDEPPSGFDDGADEPDESLAAFPLEPLEPLEPPPSAFAPELPEPVAELSEPASVAVPDPDPLPEPPSDDAEAARAADRAVAPRSFFAQPVPLKWIVGAENALVTGPPWQTGQDVGPSAWTPWMTSNRVPHWAQM